MTERRGGRDCQRDRECVACAADHTATAVAQDKSPFGSGGYAEAVRRGRLEGNQGSSSGGSPLANLIKKSLLRITQAPFFNAMWPPRSHSRRYLFVLSRDSPMATPSSF